MHCRYPKNATPDLGERVVKIPYAKKRTTLCLEIVTRTNHLNDQIFN